MDILITIFIPYDESCQQQQILFIRVVNIWFIRFDSWFQNEDTLLATLLVDT